MERKASWVSLRQAWGGTELCRLSEAGLNLLRTRLTLRQGMG